MALDPEISRQLGQQSRLWLLSLACAAVGAFVVWRTGTVGPGVIAFLITLAALGIPLLAYERRRTRRR